jgi:acyl-coenzyme A synthetase/AMP-(fatty) acid ligase
MSIMADRLLSFKARVLTSRAKSDVLIHFEDQIIQVGDLSKKSCFKAKDQFINATVLIAVTQPLACALALIELDSVAKRVIICPPLIPMNFITVLAQRSGADTIIVDPDRADERAFPNALRIVVFKGLVHPAQESLGTITTEWILLTSGTTGVPKMVAHSFESLTSNIRRPESKTEHIVWASFNDTRRFSGLQMLLQAMLTDSSLVLRNYHMSVADFLPVLAKNGATHVSGTPTHWRKVLMFPGRRDFVFQQITLVGEIADQPLLDLLRAAYPDARITHIYGSTESGTGFLVHDCLAGFPKSLLGRNLSGAEFAVDGDALKVKSVRAARGYVGTEQQLKDPDGFIDTGDVVKLVGERYFFLGRRSGTVIIGGSHVHPEEVEAILNLDHEVRMCRVSVKKSPFTGSILVADVVLGMDHSKTPNNIERKTQSLLELCRSKLDGYKVPALIRVVDDISIGEAGKLERKNA